MVYLTGDIHGDIRRIEHFCAQSPELTTEDVLIVLGDAGFNYYDDVRDDLLKSKAGQLPITIFCIHGNHEMRPHRVHGYEETIWNGGLVFRQKEFPNLLFAKDGEVFSLNGHKTIAIGGAYSVDKYYRIANHYHWFEDEQPTPGIKQAVESRLEKECWQVDTVLSHTCPSKYVPTEAFIDGIDDSTVDRSTEEWLDMIEDRAQYRNWYCGHFHIEKAVDKMQFLFRSIIQIE